MCIDCEVDSMQVDEKVYRPSVIEGTMLRAGREERHQYRFTMRARNPCYIVQQQCIEMRLRA